MSQNDTPAPATPAAGLAMARLQLMAMIGMGVHYSARGSADGVYGTICRAATITEALDLDSSEVSLMIANPTGVQFEQGIRYDPAGGTGSWHWPERV